MAIKVLLRKLKNSKIRRSLATKGIEEKEKTKSMKPWAGISHGYHMVEREGASKGSVLVQREQIGASEVWLFRAYDQEKGCQVMKHLQSHLFDKKLSEYEIGTNAKMVMKKAHEEHMVTETGGSATMLVINSDRFIAAECGGYKAVVSKDGMASEVVGRKQHMKEKGRWSIFDMLQVKCAGGAKDHKLFVSSQKAGPKTDFIILASHGIWEVMRIQEAVDLVYHIEDPEKAAECLAEEALTRMSKSTISCVVIRFH